MASSKRLGFFWGDDKVTLVEFDRNAPVQTITSPLGSKASTSPFSSNLTEEIQITALLKKMLEDSHIKGGTFYVSLPMKEIILRSFVIPFVRPEDIHGAIKFEAKRYVPFDIQDLSYVFHTIPFVEGHNKRLQVIFFAARKEVLSRYERIFKLVNAEVSYSEPYIVSLAKALLYRKEIKASDHLAFLSLDKNLGHICFIDKGIPQFIREFPIGSASQSEETNDSPEALNLKIVNEVGNSFDFYGRQFSGGPIEQVLVSSEFVQKDLLETLEAELKIKILKFSPVVNMGAYGQSNDMDTIYAMGACVTPPIESLTKFNFIVGETKHGFENEIITALKPFKMTIITLLACMFLLIGVYTFFQIHIKFIQSQYDHLCASEGVNKKVSQDDIQTELQQNLDKLSQYKDIRTKSDLATIILRVASHLPKGTLLTKLAISYKGSESNKTTAIVEMQGLVITGDFGAQIATVNKMFAEFKNDKILAGYIKLVNLGSLDRQTYNNKQVTGFAITFS